MRLFYRWTTPCETCLWAYTDREGPDQTAHPRSLIKALAVHKEKHLILKNVSMESKCPDNISHEHDDVNRNILRLLKGTFSFDVTQMLF